MDILAEELLKISYVGERISDESLEEGMDLDVIAENAEEGVTFINNILEDRGFDLDKLNQIFYSMNQVNLFIHI